MTYKIDAQDEPLIRYEGRTREEVISEAYRLLAPKVLGLCYSYLKNPDDAKDTVNEAFFNAFNGFESFKGESAIGTWICSIAINCCSSVLKRRQRRSDIGQPCELLEERVYEPPWGVDSEAGPEDNAISKEQYGAFTRAMQKLDEGDRRLVELALSGATYREAAASLGVTESAYKTKAFRARKELTRRVRLELGR